MVEDKIKLGYLVPPNFVATRRSRPIRGIWKRPSISLGKWDMTGQS